MALLVESISGCFRSLQGASGETLHSNFLSSRGLAAFGSGCSLRGKHPRADVVDPANFFIVNQLVDATNPAGMLAAGNGSRSDGCYSSDPFPGSASYVGMFHIKWTTAIT